MDIRRGLSLTQPWATLIAIGAKTIETRSFPTSFRGWVAIHASKYVPPAAAALCSEEPFLSVLLAHQAATGQGPLPTGAIVAVARIVDVHRTEVIQHAGFPGRPPHERAFGDYTTGRFGWVLRDVRALRAPIPCKGALGLWPLDRDDPTLPRRVLEALTVAA